MQTLLAAYTCIFHCWVTFLYDLPAVGQRDVGSAERHFPSGISMKNTFVLNREKDALHVEGLLFVTSSGVFWAPLASYTSQLAAKIQPHNAEGSFTPFSYLIKVLDSKLYIDKSNRIVGCDTNCHARIKSVQSPKREGIKSTECASACCLPIGWL